MATKLSAVELTQIATPFVVAFINANAEKLHLVDQDAVVNAALGLATKLYQGASDRAEGSAEIAERTSGELSLEAMQARNVKRKERPVGIANAQGDAKVSKEILDSGEL